MGSPYNIVSRDGADRLTEFSDDMRAALVLAEVTPWAEANGLVRTTDALKTTFPIPISAAGYQEFKGDIKYRSLFERSLSMISYPFQDGVAELARVIEAPDFIDWAGEPERIAFEWKRLPNERVAAMLAESSYAGPLLDLYYDKETKTASAKRMFASGHPYNVFDDSIGTFDNRMQCTLSQILSGEIFDRLARHFRSIKGPNGKPLGLRFTGGKVVAPGGLENTFKEATEQDTLIRAVSDIGDVNATADVVAAVTQGNRHRGTYSYDIADEFGTNDYFYALAAGRPGMVPWVIQTRGSPEEIRSDRDSYLYQTQLKLGVAYIGELGVAAALPHGIVRVEVTDAPE
jgi:hypothetical protein